MKAKLAELKGKPGKTSHAAALFQEAADLVMNAGKMETANNWSMRAAEDLEGYVVSHFICWRSINPKTSRSVL